MDADSSADAEERPATPDGPPPTDLRARCDTFPAGIDDDPDPVTELS